MGLAFPDIQGTPGLQTGSGPGTGGGAITLHCGDSVHLIKTFLFKQIGKSSVAHPSISVQGISWPTSQYGSSVSRSVLITT